MKKIISLFSLLFLAVFSFAQTPNWAWAKSGGGWVNPADDVVGDEAFSVAADAFGNVYVAGYFESDTIIFGSDTLINANLSGGFDDVFLVKYNGNNGNVIWARRAGGRLYDFASSVAVDASGNIYLTGYFQSDTIIFGTTTLMNHSNSGTTYDMFLAKYNSSGVVQWAKRAGGNSDDEAFSVTTGLNGNIYLTGSFKSDTIVFGNDTLINTRTPYGDVFVVEYNNSGNVLWAKKAGGRNDDVAYSITADNSGNVYITGYYQSDTIFFGSDSLVNDYGGYKDIFVVKYNGSNGNVIWAKRAGGFTDDKGYSITASDSGNVYVSGVFLSPSIVFGTTTLTNTDNTFKTFNLFLVKYNSSGNVLWAKSAGGEYNGCCPNGEDGAFSVVADAYDNVFMAGYFDTPKLPFPTDTLINAGLYDMFVTEYNSHGNELWVKSAGGLNDDGAYAVTTGNYGNIYVVGYFQSDSISFGAYNLLNIADTGFSNMYIANLDVTTGIKNIVKQGSISVYPNPNKGIFTITTNSNKPTTLEVYDVYGGKVIIKQILTSSEQIDLSGFAEGMYELRMINNDSVYIGKVIIE